jgi:hypothetical protein
VRIEVIKEGESASGRLLRLIKKGMGYYVQQKIDGSDSVFSVVSGWRYLRPEHRRASEGNKMTMEQAEALFGAKCGKA